MSGNKRKLTPEFIREFAGLIATGLKNIDACDVMGVSESRFYAWMRLLLHLVAWMREPRDEMEEKLYQALKKARGQRKGVMLKTIMQAAQGGQWQAAAWYLERVYPQEFAKTVRKEEDGSAAQIDAIRELIAEVKKDAER